MSIANTSRSAPGCSSSDAAYGSGNAKCSCASCVAPVTSDTTTIATSQMPVMHASTMANLRMEASLHAEPCPDAPGGAGIDFDDVARSEQRRRGRIRRYEQVDAPHPILH